MLLSKMVFPVTSTNVLTKMVFSVTYIRARTKCVSVTYIRARKNNFERSWWVNVEHWFVFWCIVEFFENKSSKKCVFFLIFFILYKIRWYILFPIIKVAQWAESCALMVHVHVKCILRYTHHRHLFHSKNIFFEWNKCLWYTYIYCFFTNSKIYTNFIKFTHWGLMSAPQILF